MVDPDTLFDVQVKRIHEYKRQLLNILHVISLYNQIKKNPAIDIIPRTVDLRRQGRSGILHGQADHQAHQLGRRRHRRATRPCKGRLNVVFYPDFNVKNGQMIYPAADLSEQISTAGKEASGTGNMKFSMNGALTIGTLDGANVEIRQEVGAENFFLFGLTVEQVLELKASGYNPRHYYEMNPVLHEAIDQIAAGVFSGGNRELFRPIVDSLLNQDTYLVLADFQAYLECQYKVAEAFRDQEHWTRMSILNVARMGKFSSDRSIREYCANIWDTTPIDVQAELQAALK